MNDKLQMHGKVELNEVYDYFREQTNPYYEDACWTLENGDGYIDFNIYNKENVDFVNGLDYKIILDFNVDQEL
jgi:hypothetical protein